MARSGITNLKVMIEVFKTNITDRHHANRLIDDLHKIHPDYKANFDLDDHDRILRVENKNGLVPANSVIRLVNDHGFEAEVLPDEIPLARYLLIGEMSKN